jgi:hypothetical protein
MLLHEWCALNRLSNAYFDDKFKKKTPFTTCIMLLDIKKRASAGNRTRAARVAGEHSTTEPPMRCTCLHLKIITGSFKKI